MTYVLHNANGYLKEMVVVKENAMFLETTDLADARTFATQGEAIQFANDIPTHHTFTVKEKG